MYMGLRAETLKLFPRQFVRTSEFTWNRKVSVYGKVFIVVNSIAVLY